MDKGRCYEKLGEWNQATAAYGNIMDKFKVNLELSIQDRSKTYVEKAKEVVSKYQVSQAGLDLAGSDGQWFELLKKYDKAIFSQKAQWSQNKSADALKLLHDYEELTSDFIKSVITGREFENQGDWDSALRFYRRVVNMSFLPSSDIFEEAKLRVNWISMNSNQ